MSNSPDKNKFLQYFLISNIAIPVIGLFVGIFIPHSVWETAIVSLFVLCLTNLIILIYEVQTLKAGLVNKYDDIAANIHESLMTFPEVGNILALVENSDAKEYLKDMSKLHNGLANKTRFVIADDLILKYLVSSHMSGYVTALTEALHKRSLPLASLTRMRAAAEAIADAKEEILAVSADNDRWLHASVNNHYFRSNIEKAQKLSLSRRKRFKFQRVYILNSESELKMPNLKKLFEAQKKVNIEIRYAIKDDLRQRLSEAEISISLVNILICDQKILAHSTNEDIHEGYLILNKEKIDEYLGYYNVIWENSAPV